MSGGRSNGNRREAQARLYRAIIDELTSTTIHVWRTSSNLADVKDLLRAGSTLAHMNPRPDISTTISWVSSTRPNVFPADLMGERRAIMHPTGLLEEPLLHETFSPKEIEAVGESSRQSRHTGGRAAGPSHGAGQSPEHPLNCRRRDAGGGDRFRGVTGDQYFGLAPISRWKLGDTGGADAHAGAGRSPDLGAILGLDQLGTIAPGKSADFVVLNATAGQYRQYPKDRQSLPAGTGIPRPPHDRQVAADFGARRCHDGSACWCLQRNIVRIGACWLEEIMSPGAIRVHRRDSGPTRCGDSLAGKCAAEAALTAAAARTVELGTCAKRGKGYPPDIVIYGCTR